MTLSPRQEAILKIVVGEYIATVVPVGSESIARRHALRVSPATIRNDMAYLEEEGYITHPHTSAGRIPSDRGYRYYVESLMEQEALPQQEQRLIRHQFHQVERELEEWTRLAAAILARLAQNLALVTLPRAVEFHFKHLELVSLHDFLALLILVLQEARTKQQLLPLTEATTQEQLTAVANRLNGTSVGLASYQIPPKGLEPSVLEEQVNGAVARLIQAEDEHPYQDARLEGLRYLLGQPEFTSGEKMLAMVDVLEDRSRLQSLLPSVITEDGVKVVIGQEITEDTLRNCSVVVTRYGIPGEMVGTIGVLGPTRMPYSRAIATVQYLGNLMSGLVAEYHG